MLQDKTKFKLSPPWITYFNEIKALFEPDPDIRIEYDNENYTIRMYVDCDSKAYVLNKLIPDVRTYGNVTVKTIIVPPNDSFMSIDTQTPLKKKEMFEMAFSRNPVFSFVYDVDTIFSNSIYYVVFKNKVVQFFNDNLGDIYGNMSTLYQYIAEDIFCYNSKMYDFWGDKTTDYDNFFSNVYFCTDVEEKVGKPLGEWP